MNGEPLKSRATWALIGCNSRSTFDRTRADPREKFPEPVVIRGRLYWHEAEVRAWLDARPRLSEVMLRRRRIRAVDTIDKAAA